MIKNLFLLTVVTTLLSVLSYEAVAGSSSKSFQNQDLNDDGVLIAAEVRDSSVKLFKKLDRNNNNSLQINEILTHDPNPSGKFRGMDTNNDGRISMSEYVRKKVATFHVLDHNNDGRISENEYVRAHRAYMEKHYNQKK